MCAILFAFCALVLWPPYHLRPFILVFMAGCFMHLCRQESASSAGLSDLILSLDLSTSIARER